MTNKMIFRTGISKSHDGQNDFRTGISKSHDEQNDFEDKNQ